MTENTEISRLSRKIEKLDKSINDLADIYDAQSDIKNIAVTNIFKGLFTAIGASIVFAVFILVADQALEGLENVPVLDNLIERINDSEIIKQYTE